MRYRPRIVGKRTLGLRRRGTCSAFRIELERNDVSDVIFLCGRAYLEADFSLRATQELALNQAAVLQLQCIGPRHRRRQSQRSKESVFQLEPHDVFPFDASALLPRFMQIIGLLGTHLEPKHCLFNMIPSPSNPDWFN